MSNNDSSRLMLFDFENKTDSNRWIAVNDGVMGGISKGDKLIADDGCLVFSGSLSLENNGGFSSIRTLPADFELDGYSGIRIRVKGDGRTYQFRIRTSEAYDGVAFKSEFQTSEDEWLEIDLPFDRFLPTFRGRILENIPPLDPAAVRQIGFLIADKTAGPFELQVDSISAYK